MNNTAAIASELSAFAADVAGRLPNGHTGSGMPSRRARKIIGGEMVQVWAIGYGAVDVRVELIYVTGTKPLTIAEAAELIAA